MSTEKAKNPWRITLCGTLLFALISLVNIHSWSSSYLKQVFTVPAMRAEFAGFLDTVLKQISPADFFALLDKHKICEHVFSDTIIYKRLLAYKSKLQPTVPFYHKIKSLYDQKAVLAQQAQELLAHGQNIGQNISKNIENYVEVGSPGTYRAPLSKFLTITGKSTSVVDKKRWSDRVQSFSPFSLSSLKPYDNCVALNDYAEITQEAIASNSVDLVVCFVGLHHIPQEKLDGFIACVQRILRPGGIFLLREHNSKDSRRKALIYAAHSVYNILITGASPEAEAREYRNFQPIEYWIALLEKHGLSVDSKQLTQQGDPTLNTMLKCTKTAHLEQDKITEITHNLHYTPDYKRDLAQTYLSSPEWLNVDVAQEYGMFIEHTPFYEFPYFKSIAAYWDVFKKSWHAAAQKNGILKTTLSPYTLMNSFIGATMTLEYAAKGIISAPVRWLYSGQESSKIKVLVKDPKDQLENLDGSITLCQKYEGTSVKLIELPRSKEFLRVLLKLLETDVSLLEIAGQKQIQVKIRQKTNTRFTTIPNIPNNTLKGCVKEYDWTLPTQPDFTYSALTVEISELKNVIKQLNLAGSQILYIHDY